MREELQSPCLPPDRLRNLVVELEQHGLESSRVDVVAAPAQSVTEMSDVDRESVGRPFGRAALGLVVGAVVGLLIGAVVVALSDDLPVGTLVGTAIAGALLGGLFNLYRRLPVGTDLVDADTGQDSMVRVDVSGLDDDAVRQVEQLIAQS